MTLEGYIIELYNRSSHKSFTSYFDVNFVYLESATRTYVYKNDWFINIDCRGCNQYTDLFKELEKHVLAINGQNKVKAKRYLLKLIRKSGKNGSDYRKERSRRYNISS